MPVLMADQVAPSLKKGSSARRSEAIVPKFKVGDEVTTRNIHPTGHTRIPRYVRGRLGVVSEDHGVFIFPDTHAMGEGTKPQHVYSVCFDAQELWGRDASSQNKIYVDLWDDYLEPVR